MGREGIRKIPGETEYIFPFNVYAQPFTISACPEAPLVNQVLLCNAGWLRDQIFICLCITSVEIKDMATNAGKDSFIKLIYPSFTFVYVWYLAQRIFKRYGCGVSEVHIQPFSTLAPYFVLYV